MKIATCFVLSALVLAGCSHSSTSTYDAADVGRTIDSTKASVIASRLVDISGETNAVGPVAGGVAGAAGTGLAVEGGNSLAAAVLGGLVGAGAGYLTQKALNNREGIEYTLQMEDGRTTTLVQNRETDEQPLPDGTPVLVQVSGQYTRVIADPTADRSSSSGGTGSWTDPDTEDAGGGKVAPEQRQ